MMIFYRKKSAENDQKSKYGHETHQYWSDGNNFGAVRKLTVSAFQRRQARQNPFSRRSIRGHVVIFFHHRTAAIARPSWLRISRDIRCRREPPLGLFNHYQKHLFLHQKGLFQITHFAKKGVSNHSLCQKGRFKSFTLGNYTFFCCKYTKSSNLQIFKSSNLQIFKSKNLKSKNLKSKI